MSGFSSSSLHSATTRRFSPPERFLDHRVQSGRRSASAAISISVRGVPPACGDDVFQARLLGGELVEVGPSRLGKAAYTSSSFFCACITSRARLHLLAHGPFGIGAAAPGQ